MLEIRQSRSAIVSCLDERGVLDGMPDFAGAFKARTATDELWLIGPASSAGALLAHATDHLVRAGTSGLAVDVSDGWSVLTVQGAGTAQVWERFSENPIPAGRPAFVQGAVAAVPTKAVIFDSCIHFLIPAPLGYHLPHRILHGCADLAPRMADPADFVLYPTAIIASGGVL
ncbi:MAG: hypothetical protein AABZ29_02990 [Gemmatimonadota bacterium]